ncbi:hypothetical protein HN51_028135, partial [Arachis hypogaea]
NQSSLLLSSASHPLSAIASSPQLVDVTAACCRCRNSLVPPLSPAAPRRRCSPPASLAAQSHNSSSSLLSRATPCRRLLARRAL